MSDRDFMPSLAEEASPESEHSLSAVSGPPHASLFHTLLNQGFGCGFDGAAADREASLSIGSVVHASSVFPQLGNRLSDFWGRLCEVGIETQDAAEEEAQLTRAKAAFWAWTRAEASDEVGPIAAAAIRRTYCSMCHQSRISMRRGKQTKTIIQIQMAPSLMQTIRLAFSTPRR